jgi:DNA polymerase sigma
LHNSIFEEIKHTSLLFATLPIVRIVRKQTGLRCDVTNQVSNTASETAASMQKTAFAKKNWLSIFFI